MLMPQLAGIDGGLTSNVSTLLLNILQANPSLYEHLANATLVQDVNAVDTLENTMVRSCLATSMSAAIVWIVAKGQGASLLANAAILTL